VGVNFAKALALVWGKPLVSVNHMEGHMLAALAKGEGDALAMEGVRLPVLGLLISGGHTELDLMDSWLSYRLVGATKDDAAGEAFDKVARMLGLPYPGGPEVSKLARAAREAGAVQPFSFPRPMLREPHCDFSFSGLKTSVMYQLKKIESLTDDERAAVAREFEDAVAEVLYGKASRALAETGAQTLVIGGGVSGNTHIQERFQEKLPIDHPEVELRIPERALTTDNAVMIGIAGFYRALRKEFIEPGELRADGNRSLA
jgi:N6-L-threonylcarbamoyladenine synthase